jgi:predicted nuclease of restriction endonuclease-like (RecB) superfamily
MSKENQDLSRTTIDELFNRIVSILEQARSDVVRAVNSNMVIAYWLIGREILHEIQGGTKRATYGKQIIAQLSEQLTAKYGSGFSVANLRNFRQFYEMYPDRLIHYPMGSELDLKENRCLESSEHTNGFSPLLSWSHYRALMRVGKPEARVFYEREAIASVWDKRTLERQIHSCYYERMLKSQDPQTMLQFGRQQVAPHQPAIESLKNPYVLEFLGLPDTVVLHETQLESAIITHLQAFLLELGKGFAFVARQKRLRFEETDLYVDLVFYNCILKCYLLIDLKMGEISHQDVGQMDGYVRLFDDLFTVDDDNPTIGLILCTEKNEAVAKYSVLRDRMQIFASKYMLYLPTEEELTQELARERRLIEAQLADQSETVSKIESVSKRKGGRKHDKE